MSKKAAESWEFHLDPDYYCWAASSVGNYVAYIDVCRAVAKSRSMRWRAPADFTEVCAERKLLERAALKPQKYPKIHIEWPATLTAMRDGARRQAVDYELESHLIVAHEVGRRPAPYAELAADRSVIFANAMNEFAVIASLAIGEGIGDMADAQSTTCRTAWPELWIKHGISS